MPPLFVSQRNNFVERPWGGVAIRPYKNLHPLPDQVAVTGMGLGEAFEIAAWDEDPEARNHPTWVRLHGYHRKRLSALLAEHADSLLGGHFVRCYGRGYPLLPKTLDIRELLSVQGHPPGHTEAYVVIAAEPGASIRLGCARALDPAQWRGLLKSGLRAQQCLLECFEPSVDEALLHTRLAPWLAQRDAPAALLQDGFGDFRWRGRWTDIATWLDALKHIYWEVLDGMNEIHVAPGQVIHNETPQRLRVPGALPTAEVHALGNPSGKEILMLEVRRPGPTLRAWDNVRFPMRPLDIDGALEVLSFAPTAAEDFIVVRPGEADNWCSIDGAYFKLEHLCPRADRDCRVVGGWPHSLHVTRGRVVVEVEQPRARFVLERGDSALVSAEATNYVVKGLEVPAEVVKAALPQMR